MINLNWDVDFLCSPVKTTLKDGSEFIAHTSDVTLNEFSMMVNCINENSIDNYLEVGVWYGATLYHITKLFYLNGHTLDAYGYDCFDDGVTGINSHTSGWPELSIVQNKLSELPNIKLITGAAIDINKIITHRKFDFVFHDANHTKEAIVDDLIVLKDILNPNAFVAVHNSAWNEPHRNFYGKDAIDNLVSSGHYKFVNSADTAVLLQLV